MKNKILSILKRTLKWIGFLLSVPLFYVLISLLCSVISVNTKDVLVNNSKTIYLSTNGVHLDIIIPKKHINSSLLKSLYVLEDEDFISFGWGDENFYINTPTWGDLTLKNAFSALFLKSSTLVHLTRYKNIHKDWVKVNLDDDELRKLNAFILDTFKFDNAQNIIILPEVSYFDNDNFYKAKGSYSCFNTCNSWVNRGFKTSGLKACFWTPFDFGLLNKYN
ncbi:TIGR02117 family protein [Flavobacteriaceae bacterium MHTCC 0001]